MRLGALIITTGLSPVSGVAALLKSAGSICSGQRMISAFHTAGVSMTGLVVEREDKKLERQLAQNGVVFLRCEEDSPDFFRGVCQGLSFLADKFDRVFLVPGDMSLFLPSTLMALLRTEADAAQPEYKHVGGFPLLLSRRAMEQILSQPDWDTALAVLHSSALTFQSVPVQDAGILLHGADFAHRQSLIQRHNSQLSRPVTRITLGRCRTICDPQLAMLLDLVEYTGSVRDSCSLMQLSYSSAWNLLNQVEDELGFPLVIRLRGGSVGSGSVLTEKGRRLLERYHRFAEESDHIARELYQSYFSEFFISG